MSEDHEPERVKLDLSDVDPRVGQLVGGGQLWEACSATDIRRWVHAMDYPNPIHWNQEFARSSKFGGIVAPQSFVVCMDYGHGVHPACVGRIPGSHLIFGGEEWWFYGPRIRPRRSALPGAALPRLQGHRHQVRRADDVLVGRHGPHQPARRAGGEGALDLDPLPRGGGREARLLREPATSRSGAGRANELEAIAKIRTDWLLSNRLGVSPHFEEVQVGDRLPRRVIGPHSIASFAAEYRAFMFDAWGTWHWVDSRRASRTRGPRRMRAGSTASASTRKARRSTRASATASSWAPRAATSTTSAPARSACSAPTATARRWAPGRTTTSPTGRATTATSGTRSRSSARPRSRAT